MEVTMKEANSGSSNSILHKLVHLDKALSAQFFSFHGYLRPLLITLEVSGDGLIWIPSVFAAWLTQTPKSFNTALLSCVCLGLFLAFLLDLIVLGSLKSIVRRPRPLYNKGMQHVLAVDKWSFPSGHSSRAFLISSFVYSCRGLLLDEYQHHRDMINLVMWCAMLWSTMTALSRVFLGRHYVLDVVAGSVVGIVEAYVAGKFLWVPLERSEQWKISAWSCLSLQADCRNRLLDLFQLK